MSEISKFPLRLPHSLKAAAEEAARADGVSLNQLVVTAVAEKLSALRTAEFFEERRARADREQALAILSREGGAPPAPEDSLP